MTPEKIHQHITALILAKLGLGQPDPSSDDALDAENRAGATHARRGEALREFLALSLPGLDEGSVGTLAELVPELPEELYRKWIDMFTDRLLETIPQDQLDELCSGTTANNATLTMVYLMFMESARMEKQVAQDLAALSNQPAQTDAKNEQLDALSCYLKAKRRQKPGN